MGDKNMAPPQGGLYPQLQPMVLPNPSPQVPPMVLPNPNMSTQVGPNSCRLTCPSCHAQISTRCEKSATTKTHVLALVLCLFLCWPCVCLPYCMDSCRATNHFCPNCGAFLGTYDR